LPLKTWDLKSDWDTAYSFGAEGDLGHPNTRAEVRVHYHRASKAGAQSLDHATKLAAALGWTPPGDTILIAGAGFGWTPEALESIGFTTVVGTDVSTYIQGNKDGDEDAELDAEIALVGLDPATGEGLDIKNRIIARGGGSGNRTRNSRGVLNENGQNGGSRGRIKQALGLSGNERIEWVVSESVIESLTDAEAIDASDDADIIGNNTVHFIYPLRTNGNQQAGFNWKTLENWKLLIPGDTFVEAGTYRVL
jgi:hypothetical protein